MKEHNHTHGTLDSAILSTQKGMEAVTWSLFGLIATALFQLVVVFISESVALLADTIHNFGDAFTAVPLWIAFRLARMKPTKRFTYGLGRVEDLAGILIVLTILLSALVAGYESVQRLLHPRGVENLWAVACASVVGFLGNEAVALYRMKVGREIGSAALIVDGYHARVDGLTSLAVLAGVIGVFLGYPQADAIIGLIITIAIVRIVWESGKSVFTRLLDGVDEEVVDEIRHAVNHTPGVCDITEVRVRWLGHRLHAEVNVAVNPHLSLEEGHAIGVEVRHRIMHHLRYLSNVTVHIDPLNASGEEHHCIDEHEHDDLPSHSHL